MGSGLRAHHCRTSTTRPGLSSKGVMPESPMQGVYSSITAACTGVFLNYTGRRDLGGKSSAKMSEARLRGRGAKLKGFPKFQAMDGARLFGELPLSHGLTCLLWYVALVRSSSLFDSPFGLIWQHDFSWPCREAVWTDFHGWALGHGWGCISRIVKPSLGWTWGSR